MCRISRLLAHCLHEVSAMTLGQRYAAAMNIGRVEVCVRVRVCE